MPPNCKERGVNARIADKLVWDGIAKFMTSPDLVKKEALKFTGDKQSTLTNYTGEADELKREIEKIKKEEQRYIKAFGAEIISIEQFKDAIGDLKTRRAVLEKQIGHLEISKQDSDGVILPSDDQLNDFTRSAGLVLKNHLSFDKKQVIIRKVVDTIVAKQTRLIVRGYLPIREEIQNYVKFQSERWDSWFTKRRKKHAF